MRFCYAEAMVDPAMYRHLAVAAEDAGYDAMMVPDSIAYPAHSDATYPYTADGDRGFLEDKPFLDPLTLVAGLGMVTERLRFVTSVLKLTVRSPVLVAKQATSVVSLIGDRLALGVGTSPWPEDYELTGVPWRGRGRRCDECIDVIRGFSAGGWFEHHGEHVQVPKAKMAPTPERPIPILVGGHSDAALRRAAERGDGWLHGGGDSGELGRLLDRLDAARQAAGTGGRPFEVHAITADAYSLDGIRRLEDRGVTDVVVGFRWVYQGGPDTEDLQTKLDALRRYAERVIAASR